MNIDELPQAAAALIGPGGPYEVQEAAIDGATLRVFRQAPANLGALYQAALAYGDREFYVYQDERHTFAEAWALCRQVARRPPPAWRAARRPKWASPCATIPNGFGASWASLGWARWPWP